MVTKIMVTNITTFGGARLSLKGLCLTFALIFGLAQANAITIRFDDADRPPSDTLNVGGVTVTGGVRGPGLPATAFGVGLGSDSLGSGSSFAIEQVANYPAGVVGSHLRPYESLQLTVDGMINSITIMPRISVILETGESLDLTFGFLLLENGSLPGSWRQVECDGTSKTIDLTSSGAPSVDIWLESNFGEDLVVDAYRSPLGYPAVSIVYGFAIQSLDYTPVPDTANSACLLGIGIFGIVCAGRKRVWSARS